MSSHVALLLLSAFVVARASIFASPSANYYHGHAGHYGTEEFPPVVAAVSSRAYLPPVAYKSYPPPVVASRAYLPPVSYNRYSAPVVASRAYLPPVSYKTYSPTLVAAYSRPVAYTSDVVAENHVDTVISGPSGTITTSKTGAVPAISGRYLSAHSAPFSNAGISAVADNHVDTVVSGPSGTITTSKASATPVIGNHILSADISTHGHSDTVISGPSGTISTSETVAAAPAVETYVAQPSYEVVERNYDGIISVPSKAIIPSKIISTPVLSASYLPTTYTYGVVADVATTHGHSDTVVAGPSGTITTSNTAPGLHGDYISSSYSAPWRYGYPNPWRYAASANVIANSNVDTVIAGPSGTITTSKTGGSPIISGRYAAPWGYGDAHGRADTVIAGPSGTIVTSKASSAPAVAGNYLVSDYSAPWKYATSHLVGDNHLDEVVAGPSGTIVTSKSVAAPLVEKYVVSPHSGYYY